MPTSILKMHKMTLAILIPGLALLACTSMNTPVVDTPEVTTATPQKLEPTVTPLPSLTPPATPSATPSSTPTPGPSPTLASTPVFGSASVGNDFLLSNQPEGCELPCWQGLVVGKSNVGDIQTVLDAAFGFNGSYDFFGNAREAKTPGLMSASYHWEFPVVLPESSSPESFHVVVLIDRDLRLLEAIRFAAISSRFSEFTNPQHVMRELGKPSMIWVKMGRSEDGHEGMARLMIIYDKGITILYNAIRVQYDDFDLGTLCLGPQPPNVTYYWMEAYLTRPIPDTVEAFLPVHKDLFGNTLTGDSPGFKSFESVFGSSLEEITEMAQQPGDMCISAEAPG